MRIQLVVALSIALAATQPCDAQASGVELPFSVDDQFPSVLEIHNRGSAPVLLPRVVAADGVDLSSLTSIVASITKPEDSDAERARRLWRWTADQLQHHCSDAGSQAALDFEPYFTLVRSGFACCDQAAPALAALWETAGFETRLASMTFHTVPEVFLDGSWRMFDPDHKVAYTFLDNRYPASVSQLAARPDLVSSVPDPVGYDSRWMAYHYQTQGSSAQYSTFGGYIDHAGFQLPAGASLQISKSQARTEFHVVVPVDLRNPTVNAKFEGVTVDAHGVRRSTPGSPGTVRLQVTSPLPPTSLSLAAVADSLPAQLEASLTSSDRGMPSNLKRVISGHITLDEQVTSLSATSVWIVLHVPEQTLPPLLRIDYSGSGVSSLMPDETLTLLYRDSSPASQARDIELLADGKPVARLTTEGSIPTVFEERGNEAGTTTWRTYLADANHWTGTTLDTPSNAGHPDAVCRVSFLGRRAYGEATDARPVITIAGQKLEIESLPDGSPGWFSAVVPRSLLCEEMQTEVRIGVEGRVDPISSYLVVYGSDGGTQRSKSSQGADLSTDPGEQTGELIVRLSCGP